MQGLRRSIKDFWASTVAKMQLYLPNQQADFFVFFSRIFLKHCRKEAAESPE